MFWYVILDIRRNNSHEEVDFIRNEEASQIALLDTLIVSSDIPLNMFQYLALRKWYTDWIAPVFDYVVADTCENIFHEEENFIWEVEDAYRT